jgi:hypothetical protein
MSSQLSVPIATAVIDSSTIDSLKSEFIELCEVIKVHRFNCSDFFETEEELDETLLPIEQNPEPYSNGCIKTRPIFKKYAKMLMDKIELKRYVSVCEKKIASQQDICDKLQQDVNDLKQLIAIMSTCLSGSISPLSKAIMLKKDSIETLLLNNGVNCLHHYDIFYAYSINTIKKLLEWKADINRKTTAHIKFPKKDQQHKFFELDGSNNYFINVLLNGDNILNLGPYKETEFNSVYTGLVGNGSWCCDYPYEITPLKLASLRGSLELVKFMVENGAKIGDIQYHVPAGPNGDLVAGYLQTHGSIQVKHFG